MKNGIVTAGHPKTVEAATEILLEGGNAFDAAIAALFSACLVEPALASLGGGGFMMAYPQDSSPVLLDFFVQTPAKSKDIKDINFRKFICDFGSTQQEFVIGPGTSAVPGYVKGIFEIAGRYQTMPMTELIQPAVQQLKEGIEITEMQSLIIGVLQPIYVNEFIPNIFESKNQPGTTVQAGEIVHYPNYVDLLETLAIEGEDLFYRGEIAQAVHELSESGGLVCYDDLKNYKVETRKPLQIEYSHNRIFLNPSPSSGGLSIALCFAGLRAMNLAQTDYGSMRHIKAVHDTISCLDQLNHEIAASSSEEFQTLASVYLQTLQSYVQVPRGTTHISIIDRDNNAVAVSVSNGEGCGRMIPGTSVMMNNMMGEHDVNPHGLSGWPLDTRLSSLMAPTVAVTQDQELIAIGSGGSNRIPTAILQVLLNMIQYRISTEQSVLAPRIHVHQNEIYFENLPEFPQFAEFFKDCQKTTFFPERNFFFGGVHAAKKTGNDFEGFGDARRGGVASIV